MGLDAELAAIPDADVRIQAVLGLYSLTYWNGGVMHEQIVTETLIRPETACLDRNSTVLETRLWPKALPPKLPCSSQPFTSDPARSLPQAKTYRGPA